MTDATTSKSPQNVDHEAFTKFLGLLSTDEDEAASLYTHLHEKLVVFFSLRCISDPVRAADETIDRAVIKIKTGATVPDVSKYCPGISPATSPKRGFVARRGRAPPSSS